MDKEYEKIDSLKKKEDERYPEPEGGFKSEDEWR